MSGPVRIASHPDEERLFAFVWGAYEEMPHAPKSERKVRDLVRAAVAHETADFPEAGAVLMPPIFALIDGPSGIEAAVGLHPEQWWYSESYALRGFFFHVHPDFRRGKGAHGPALKRFTVCFAQQMGMPLIEVFYGDEDAPKRRLYESALEPIGTIYAQGLAA